VSQQLPPGLQLRTAVPADLDQIGALLADRGDTADAIDHRLVVEDPEAGWESCAVVVDGDQVVSTAMLFDETLYLGEVSIEAGQVELVATAREYEGRGCVRALMRWAHQRSADRGHLAQVMLGIPYFYRRFGYEYAIPIPRPRAVSALPAAPEGVAVRPAVADDIPSMAALQAAAQRTYDLRMPHSPTCWRALVAREGSTQVVAERAGHAVATARIAWLDEGRAVLGEVAATDIAGAHALLADAANRVGTGNLTVRERPGSLAGDALDGFLAAGEEEANCYYTRVPDPAALLARLRPMLSARLDGAGLGQSSGEAIVSFFREHVRLPFEKGVFGEVVRGGRMQAPGASGGAGVAPDLVTALLFGPYGIDGLRERHPDVYPGPQRTLMSALFPPVRADLLTFYQP
jgi:predicted N-acetyltransferase YhbS